MRTKAVDLDADDPRQAVAELRAELTAADGLTEVGYRDGVRTRLGQCATPIAERPAQRAARAGLRCRLSPAAAGGSRRTSRRGSRTVTGRRSCSSDARR